MYEKNDWDVGDWIDMGNGPFQIEKIIPLPQNNEAIVMFHNAPGTWGYDFICKYGWVPSDKEIFLRKLSK